MPFPSYTQTKYIYDILDASMKGKEIEFRIPLTQSWLPMSKYTKTGWDFQNYEFRVKPDDTQTPKPQP